MERISFVDTHTGGEPTRVILNWPNDLKESSCVSVRDALRERLDHYRRAILCEPRGSEVVVGAVVVPPESTESVAGVIFANNVGYLGMCGHGTIGVAVALKHLGKISDGAHQLDTVLGPVKFSIQGAWVTLRNVESFRLAARVPVELEAGRIVHGDIAWGGNWFFICDDHAMELEAGNLKSLSEFAIRLRRQLEIQKIAGTHGALIDHIELTGPPSRIETADAKNFVLCPGGEFDRSPCGTGTSAKVACLASSGSLKEGELFRQEGIVGSVFEATYELASLSSEGTGDEPTTPKYLKVLPSISGAAYVCSEGDLLFDSEDPFRMGVPF